MKRRPAGLISGPCPASAATTSESSWNTVPFESQLRIAPRSSSRLAALKAFRFEKFSRPHARVKATSERLMLEVQRRGEFSVTQRQKDLEDARDPRGGHGMTDVRLDRSNRAKLGSPGVFGESVRQRRNLDRIPQFGSSAMRFDVANRFRRDA